VRRFALGAIGLLVVCSACQSGNNEQGPTPRGGPAIADDALPDTVRAADEDALISRADRLQVNLNAVQDASTKVTGSWFIGDVTAEFTIYFDGENESYAEERVELGDGGTAWRQYFFEDGALAFFVEEGSRPSGDSSRGGTDSVVVILDFDSQGRVESFYKTIGGDPADLGESEEARVWESVDRLRQGARQAGP